MFDYLNKLNMNLIMTYVEHSTLYRIDNCIIVIWMSCFVLLCVNCEDDDHMMLYTTF